jgi:predicted HAD superfamily Cof-like phosphohydrolase
MSKSKNKFHQGVQEFHKAFGHPVGEKPTPIPKDVAIKRAIWSAEELVEFLHATVAGVESEFLLAIEQFQSGIAAAVAKSQLEGEYTNKSDEEIVTRQSDALTDELYFNQGSFVVAGVDPQPLFDIVQDANMSKLGPDGKPIIRESDGKIMKPEGWVAPEPKLREEIKRQINEAK